MPYLASIAGLPVHPLVVHVAVVLVPLAAAALVFIAVVPRFRRSLLPFVLVLAIAGAGASIVASSTGGSLEHTVRQAAATAGDPRPRFGEHPEQGNTAEFASIVLAIAVAVVAVVEVTVAAGSGNKEGMAGALGAYGSRLPGWAPHAVYALAILPAIFAVITMIVAGHSGAALVWKDVGSYATG